MALQGLRMRRALCKICSSFKDDDVLNRITLDILLHRKSYQQIKEEYNPLLPFGVKPLNDVNIANHRKHSDPYNLAIKTLQDDGESTNDADLISQLYGRRFLDGMDRVKVLKEIYRERLANLRHIQDLLSQHHRELEVVEAELAGWRNTGDESLARQVALKIKASDLRTTVRKLTLDIDAVHNDMQLVLLKDLGLDKAGTNTRVTIVQNYVILTRDKVKSFMADLVPYLLADIFKDDSMRGKEVVQHIGRLLDKHLADLADEQLALKALKKY